MVMPETRYALTADGVSIAYAVVGDGPRDLVAVPGWVSHLEAAWEEPTLAHFYERLAVVLPVDPVRQARHRAVGPRPREPAPDARDPHG